MTNELSTNYDELVKQAKKAASARQNEASNPRISAWVEASAGTGKTKVLSDRVLRLLLDKVAPGRILCLTYTNAAAAEMKSRISKRLSEWSVQDGTTLEKNIKSLLGEDIKDEKTLAEYVARARTLFAVLLDTPGGIKIQTIHSFCGDVLKRFPLEAGISPYFEILDDRQSSEALSQIKSALLSENFNLTLAEAGAVGYLTSNLDDKSFSKVMTNITENRIKIATVLHENGGVENLLKKLRQKIGVDVNDDEETLKIECMKGINQSDLSANIKALKSGGKSDVKKATGLEKVYKNGCSVQYYDEYVGCFITKDGEIFADSKLATKTGALKADPQVLERMKDEAWRVLPIQKKVKSLKLYNSTKAFLIIAQVINDKYEEYKRLNSRLDYNDLVNITRDLLSDSSNSAWVLYKLDGGIDHILLDEAQDTSPQQWDIVKALSEEFFAGLGINSAIRTVFAVGDRKQSIFSFQGADPQKFDEMSGYFSKRAGVNFKKVGMEHSFRSTPAILQSVNTVFADSAVAAGVISPDSPVEHQAVRLGEYGKVEIWPLLLPENKEDSKEDSSLPPMEISRKTSVQTKMAVQIAQKIKQMMAETKGSVNPLQFKDFMVLVRHRTPFVDDFIRACKAEKVNISGADKMVLAKQIAVQDLISLGKFLLLPTDDLSLAEVLKSPLFNLVDDDLEKLCCEREQKSLWESLNENNDYQSVAEGLQTLMSKLDFIRPYELFNYVLVNMQGRKKFIQRMGVEAEDALDEFINLTLSYEQGQTPDLQGFIAWFENDTTAVKREGDDEEINAVRLMTVHHSKGLQARVVFLPDSVQLPRNNSEQKLLLSDDNLAYYPLCKDDYNDLCTEIKEKNGALLLEEYRRLLYVALTRAEERLIVCGYANHDSINDNTWLKICEKTLQSVAKVNNEKELIVQSEAMVEVKPKNKYFISPQAQDAVGWLETDSPKENPLAKPYTPSKLEDADKDEDSVSPLKDNVNYYRRGSLIHKILQFLPADDSVDKSEVIAEYINKNAPDFSTADKAQITQEILSLLAKEEYRELFGKDSRAEVPVFGEVGGKIISAQIDRLVVQKDKIIIVDFKTNRPAKKTLEETPDSYIKQLDVYKKLISLIYSQHNIETYILWTNEARLMRVS